MLHQGVVVRSDLAALQGPHEDDAPARAVGFVTGGDVGGTCWKAEATVDAGSKWVEMIFRRRAVAL